MRQATPQSHEGYEYAREEARGRNIRAERDAWIEMLGRYSWEWFGTFTFRDAIAPEAADKRFRILLSWANRRLYGSRWFTRGLGIRWVRALELQRRGVVHFHALLSGFEAPWQFKLKNRWSEIVRVSTRNADPGWSWRPSFSEPNPVQGIARIYPIRWDDAVIRYVTKYVVKGGEIEFSKTGFTFEPSQDGTNSDDLQVPPAPPPRRGNPQPVRPLHETEAGERLALDEIQRLTTTEELDRMLAWAAGECTRREGWPVVKQVTRRLRRRGRIFEILKRRPAGLPGGRP